MKTKALLLFLMVAIATACSKENEEYHPATSKMQGQWQSGAGEVYEFKQPKDSTCTVFKNGQITNSFKYYINKSSGNVMYLAPIGSGNVGFKDGGNLNMNESYTKMTFIHVELEKK